MPRNIEVILPLAIAETYTYRVPDDMPMPAAGMRVLVPLVRKEVVGIVLGASAQQTTSPARQQPDADKIRPVTALLDSRPAVTETQLKLWQWMSDYYLCPLGDTAATALPKRLFDRQYTVDTARRVRLPEYTGETVSPAPLSAQQARAAEEIRQQWKEHLAVLLYGVTSSGKTEVYIHLAQKVLQTGKDVLYLVPEIALTTQLTERLRRVFGNQLLVYHSRVSDGQRAETYRRILTSQPESGTKGHLVVGARSSIFLPLRNPGLFIIDEEHEPSYKQQDPAPRYHARSAAIMLAQMTGSKVLLGTATPSMETRYNAEQGKYGMSVMSERYQGLQMPRITMIDLQRQYHRKEMYGHFADPLVARIREELGKGKQIILFQNRRGYAPYMQCVQCGAVPKCPQCDVPLTLHRHLRQDMLRCHYCGSEQSAPSVCPSCGGELKIHGFGTERIEDEAASLFPEARILRMDLDSTRRKDAYQDIIRRFSAHEADLLIGTQMVTKGLHFDNVSLVGVLQADNLLNQPSFRGYERAFQLLEQVAGRAGRKEGQGEVMIQTYAPEHPVFRFVQAHDTEGFYQWQKEERRQFNYPPFCHLITLTLRHKDENRTETAAQMMQARLQQVFGARCSAVIVPGIPRISNQHIRQLQIRIEAGTSLAQARRLIREHSTEILHTAACKSVQMVPDTDPM